MILDLSKKLIKPLLKYLDVEPRRISERIGGWSIKMACRQVGFQKILEGLRRIHPDLSDQYSTGSESFNAFMEMKMRAMHAFQCLLMLRAIENKQEKKKITVVDIGDSSGTHMIYLKNLVDGCLDIDTISVNLDKRAIDKITARGLKAILCRAEYLDLGDRKIDLFTSFEMLEHLHNPAIFLHRLTKKSPCRRMLITVPYVKHSRVGLHHVRQNSRDMVYAEDEHVFELSPQDWVLLMLHSGWRIIHSETYYQYPKNWPLISSLLSYYWRITDYEGFWGVILEKDEGFSSLYQDWEE